MHHTCKYSSYGEDTEAERRGEVERGEERKEEHTSLH